ncbi:MAG: 50S ribosomal protein L15 [Oscillospiraceae bacterium]|jgi:large subunit ribosomal protein L15|nr:50S ribosomal protein L15 [Oscillospiraceae bacterium]
MKLYDLRSPSGGNKAVSRVGRGSASGSGKTSGRGHKGAKSRSGYSRKRGFEGGQMPLVRRLPKRGFVNIHAKPLTAVNLSAFDAFADGERAGARELLEKGVIKSCPHGLKVLGGGQMKHKVTVAAAAFSASAKEKIAASGGKAEVV